MRLSGSCTCFVVLTYAGPLQPLPWRSAGSSLPREAFADEDGLAALVRESRGNFRLLRKLLDQCERLVRINGLDTMSARAVDAARKTLTFGEE